ncbi:MAG: DUF4399 domain-containing protein [Pseudomonadota bacterium]
MKHVLAILAALLFFGVASSAVAQGTPSRPGTELYFLTPSDGAEISGQVDVVIGLKGMGVAPALVEWPNTGHHHILINRELGDPTLALEKNEQTIHLGGGQTETTLQLAPGNYTLMLVLGDHAHVPHDPPVTSEKISITVK